MIEDDIDREDEIDGAQSARQTKAKGRQDLIGVGLKDAMSTRQGRAWIWSLLSGAGLNANTFVPDPSTAAYLAGRHAVAVELVDEILRRAPELYLTMIRESLEK